MSNDNFVTGRSAGRERAADTMGVSRVASWRLAERPPVLAVLNRRGPMIHPPLEGELPGYVVRPDECEREAFGRWLVTLDEADRRLAEEALMLHAQGIPLDTITRRLAG